MAAAKPTFNDSCGDSLTYPNFIIAFYCDIDPKFTGSLITMFESLISDLHKKL